jgi:phosphoglycerate dehydrogenase-like enzyme
MPERPCVRFARPHYAPGLEWSAYEPLLPGWEIVAGDPTAPGALNGVDVLVTAAADAELIDAGDFGLIQQIGTGTDRIDVEAATEAGVWVSSLPSGVMGNADGVADTAVLLTLAALRRDAGVLRTARPGLIVVNVARGGLVDETALLAALDDGRVGIAGLDVFATEPPAPDDRLVHHPHVLALPHVAGVTEDMFRRAGPQLAGELERWRGGRPPRHAVNRPPSPRGLYSNTRGARPVSTRARALPAHGRSAPLVHED